MIYQNENIAVDPSLLVVMAKVPRKKNLNFSNFSLIRSLIGS